LAVIAEPVVIVFSDIVDLVAAHTVVLMLFQQTELHKPHIDWIHSTSNAACAHSSDSHA
jgi:hypothetical protein